MTGTDFKRKIYEHINKKTDTRHLIRSQSFLQNHTVKKKFNSVQFW